MSECTDIRVQYSRAPLLPLFVAGWVCALTLLIMFDLLDLVTCLNSCLLFVCCVDFWLLSM